MDERPLAVANQAFKDQNWQLAAEAYEEVYQNQPTITLNHLLAQSLLNAGQTGRALEVVFEEATSYLSDGEHLALLIEVLLANQNLLLANQVAESITQPSLRTKAVHQIENEEQRVSSEAEFASHYQQFYQLASGNLIHQQVAYEASKRLPKKVWIKAAQHLLVDPFVKPIVRVTLLEDLQKLRFDEPVNLQWLTGESRRVVPSELVPFERNSSLKEALGVLKSRLGSADPLTAQLQEENLRLQLTLLYPFDQEVISDWAVWMSLNLGESIAETPMNQEMKEWHERLSQIIQEMTV